jgi:hypothetical protein
MTAIVNPANTALDTRLVNIACADQNPDSVLSGQSLSLDPRTNDVRRRRVNEESAS